MAKSSEMSYDTKTIIIVLLLLFVYPLGLIFMFVWMKWPLWVKILILLPIVLGVLAFIGMIALISFAASTGQLQSDYEYDNYNYNNEYQMPQGSQTELQESGEVMEY